MMIKPILLSLLGLLALQSCNNGKPCTDEACAKPQANKARIKQDSMIATNKDTDISCKLTTPELQKRKETVLAGLKGQILEKKEVPNGYAFRFAGTDAVVDELAEFVKSERSCCSFFVFTLSFSGDASEAWLTLTGPEGAKEMISDELGL
jgi:hypothetical protein